MENNGHKLFEHLFELSTDAQLVICNGQIEQLNRAAISLLGHSVENTSQLFSLSPEHQPNGEESSKLGDQLLLEATVNGSARFEWLHVIDGKKVWKEYILDRITFDDKTCIHAIIRGIEAYKEQHIRANQRIERMILQNQAIGDLATLESSEFFSHDHFQKQVCIKAAQVMNVSQVIIWSWEVSKTFQTANHHEEDYMKLPEQLDLENLPRFKKALNEHVPIIINDASKDARINELIGTNSEVSLIIIPLLNEGVMHGFLWIERWNKTGTWALEETSFAIALGEMISKQTGASQKQKTELMLEQKEKMFKALVNHSLDVVCILDVKGNFTYQSPSLDNLLGYHQSMIGKNGFELIDKEDRKRLAFRFHRLTKIPNSENAFTFQARLRDGTWRYIEALARNLLNDKAISGIVVNFRDVTERMTFQKQLRIKERYYRTLIEKSLDITAIRDIRGITTYISPSIKSVFGINDSQLLGKTLNDLIHKDDREQAKKDWEFIIKNPGIPLNFEQRIELPGGEIRYVEGTARNLLADSNINGIVSNFRDITAKRDAETALIDSQLRLEAIISSAMDAIITVSQDQKIILFNSAAEEMFDCPAFEVFGTSIDRLFEKNTLNRYLKEIENLTSNPIGSLKMTPNKEDDHLMGLKAGKHKFPIDASISRQEIDNEIFYTTIVNDISERIKSEDLLKNYSKDLEKEVKRRTGQLNSKNTELNATLIELKNTQEQLIESEKMASLGQLTAGIAHEINNPINFVSSTITPLKRDLDEVKEIVNNELGKIGNGTQKEDVTFLFTEISELLNGIEEGAKRAKNIVLGLRKFSRLDEDVFKKVDIHEGLDSTIMLLNSRLRGGVSIEKNYGNLPSVECLPGKINQVFMNVVSNAIQSIEDKGVITVTTKLVNPNTVEVTVADTGIGMTKAIQKRIFEPFFTTKDVGVGTGLGLSITYGIIEDHHGNISVKSTKGKGSKFVISLPVSQL